MTYKIETMPQGQIVNLNIKDFFYCDDKKYKIKFSSANIEDIKKIIINCFSFIENKAKQLCKTMHSDWEFNKINPTLEVNILKKGLSVKLSYWAKSEKGDFEYCIGSIKIPAIIKIELDNNSFIGIVKYIKKHYSL